MATLTGDIKLNGVPYRIDLQSYRKRDMVDFSPRGSVPGGAIVMSELGLYQPLLQDDWRHGFGFHWHEDAEGYLYTSGRVETGMEGIAMLYTESTISDTIDTTKEGFITFAGNVYSWGTAGLHKYLSTGNTWSLSTGATGVVNYALPGQGYIFICNDSDRIEKYDVTGAVTASGLDANSTDYKFLIIHDGYIYAVKDGTNYVHRSSTVDLSDLEGTTGDTNMIRVGGGWLPVIGAIVYAGKLYFARSDGLWVLGDDRVCRKVIDLSSETSSTNFRSMAVHLGYLVYPVRDQIYQWNGVRVSNVTPPKVTDTYPYTTYGGFDNFVTVGEYLFCTGRTNVADFTEVLLRFDGVSWTRLADLVVNGATNGYISGMGYDAINNRLWYHNFKTGGNTSYIQFQDRSPYPYANFPTTGSNSLVTSRLHMGFKMVQKSSPSVLVEASNLTSDAVYLRAYYSLNSDTAWTAWGGTDSVTNVVDTNGVTELTNPLGTPNSTIEYYWMQLKFDFVSDSAASSPILEGYTLRFLMRPNVFFGWNLNIVAEQDYVYGAKQDTRAVKVMLDALETLRDSKAPISFEDIFGTTHYGYISSMNEQALERFDEDLGATKNIAHVVNLNITEVG